MSLRPIHRFIASCVPQRCDGGKPACQQCVRAKKSDGCEYDDGKGKTRTQIMREHIARLETRIKELESPEVTTPPITLFDPHAASPYFSESSSSSSHDSPGTTISLSASTSPAPFPIGTFSSPFEVRRIDSWAADMEAGHWDGRWTCMHVSHYLPPPVISPFHSQNSRRSRISPLCLKLGSHTVLRIPRWNWRRCCTFFFFLSCS